SFQSTRHFTLSLHDALPISEIFCGFSIVEEVYGAVFGKPQATMDKFSDGAPNFRRGNHMDAGKTAERGDFPGSAANHTRTGNNKDRKSTRLNSSHGSSSYAV